MSLFSGLLASLSALEGGKCHFPAFSALEGGKEAHRAREEAKRAKWALNGLNRHKSVTGTASGRTSPWGRAFRPV